MAAKGFFVSGQGGRLVKWLAGFVGLCLLSACACPGHNPQELANRLRALSVSVDPSEAALAAETACSYSGQLAKEYRVVRPAILHNVLVNLGIRQRGLCFQWADDLSGKLTTLQLRSLKLHRGVARLGTGREHSSVVLTAREQAFDQGIVLDAWRYSGHLFWAGVKEDNYPWIEIEVPADGNVVRTMAPAGHQGGLRAPTVARKMR